MQTGGGSRRGYPSALAFRQANSGYKSSLDLGRQTYSIFVSAPVTATIAATAFAPPGPMRLFLKLSDASLVSLLLWIASQITLTPSSLRLLEDKSRAVSPPLTASAGARAAAPSAPRWLRLRLRNKREHSWPLARQVAVTNQVCDILGVKLTRFSSARL